MILDCDVFKNVTCRVRYALNNIGAAGSQDNSFCGEQIVLAHCFSTYSLLCHSKFCLDDVYVMQFADDMCRIRVKIIMTQT